MTQVEVVNDSGRKLPKGPPKDGESIHFDKGNGRLTREKKHSCKYIVLKRRYTIKQVGINLVYNIMVTARGPFKIYRIWVLRKARKDI